MKVFLGVNTIGKTRDPGTLTYHLTGNSYFQRKIKSNMNLLTDRGFFLIPLEVLEDSWSNVRRLLGTRGNNFPVFSGSHFLMFERRRHVLGILYIMKLCM